MVLSYPNPEKAADWDAGEKGSFFHFVAKLEIDNYGQG